MPNQEMKYPNKFKELREKTGLKINKFHEEMEKVTGKKLSYHMLSLFNLGKREINAEWAGDIVKTLNALGQHVLIEDLWPGPGDLVIAGLSEDAAPWEPPKGHPLEDTNLPLHQFRWEIKENLLADIGIHAGDIGTFDMSPNAFEKVKSGDVVILQKYGKTPGETRTYVRQFIKPNLYITNSSVYPVSVFHALKDDISVKGVLASLHRTLDM